jgi:hypothetical protein
MVWISDSLIMTYSFIYFKIWQIDYSSTNPAVTLLSQTTIDDGLSLVYDMFDLVTDNNNYVYAVFRNIDNKI